MESSKSDRSKWPISKFNSHQEAEAYDRQQILAMPPEQRLELLNELRNQYWEAHGGCEPRLRRV